MVKAAAMKAAEEDVTAAATGLSTTDVYLRYWHALAFNVDRAPVYYTSCALNITGVWVVRMYTIA